MLKEEETNTEKMWKVSPGKKQNIPIGGIVCSILMLLLLLGVGLCLVVYKTGRKM